MNDMATEKNKRIHSVFQEPFPNDDESLIQVNPMDQNVKFEDNQESNYLIRKYDPRKIAKYPGGPGQNYFLDESEWKQEYYEEYNINRINQRSIQAPENPKLLNIKQKIEQIEQKNSIINLSRNRNKQK